VFTYLGGHPRFSNTDQWFAYSSRAGQIRIERVDRARDVARALTESCRIAPGRDHVATGDVGTPFEGAREGVLVE
jgi:hypothetical protein